MKKYGAYFGVLAIVIAFSTIIVTTHLHSNWFLWTEHALSDLGALGEDYAIVFNLGMTLTGLFGIIFGIGLLKRLEQFISKVGAVLFIVGMGFLILVGLFPIGRPIHTEVSWGFFLTTAVGIAFTGIGETYERNFLGYLSLLILLICVPIAYWTGQMFSGIAIPEIIGSIGFSIFCIAYSAKILSEES